MPNVLSSGNANLLGVVPTSGAAVVGLFAVLAVLVVLAIWMWPAGGRASCPKELERHTDGSLTLHGPGGRDFADMHEFEQWWQSSGMNAQCPLPVLTGARGPASDVIVSGGGGGWPNEQTYAKTPIYKVDDYEFSRIVGVERGGHLIVPKQDFNLILENRQFDWADMPVTAEARREGYMGLTEGFTATGLLTGVAPMDPAREAAARYGEKRVSRHHPGTARAHEDDMDVECKLSREAKEVAEMVSRAYANEPDYEPIITKVGPNHWEVAELKPRRRAGADDFAEPEPDRVVDPRDTRVRKEIHYEQDRINRGAIDPFFPADDGELPWSSDRYRNEGPRMDRMMGPTDDRADWSVPAPAWA
jgi:hypothetical protein